MAFLEGVGGLPSLEFPNIQPKAKALEFSSMMDKLAPPQDSSDATEFPGAGSIAVGPASSNRVAGLGQLFKPMGDWLGEVNASLGTSHEMEERLAAGENVDIHDVMIANEKAGIALQLTTQVRNKLVEAYQEVMRMQV